MKDLTQPFGSKFPIEKQDPWVVSLVIADDHFESTGKVLT